MRYVVKVERSGFIGDFYLASKRMTQEPYCEGIDNPDIMIWKTREAVEKYIKKNFSWSSSCIADYQIKECE